MICDPADLIADWRDSPWSEFATAWSLTTNAPRAIFRHIASLGHEYRILEGIAVHRDANVEEQAVLKAPCIVGPHCFVAHNAYLRGGVWLSDRVIVGPSCEIKTSFFFADSKLAHLSFIGDTVVGNAVNIEAGAMIANYRNERKDKRIHICRAGSQSDTAIDKFGALLGDGVKIGANAVIAPGAILERDSIIPRLALIDQSPEAAGQ